MLKYDNNAFLISKEDNIYLFLCMKLSQDQLYKALPLTQITADKTHLCAYFIGTQDFVGACNESDIINSLHNDIHIDLINNEYAIIQETFPSLTVDMYRKHLTFAKTQLQ